VIGRIAGNSTDGGKPRNEGVVATGGENQSTPNVYGVRSTLGLSIVERRVNLPADENKDPAEYGQPQYAFGFAPVDAGVEVRDRWEEHGTQAPIEILFKGYEHQIEPAKYH
jgi:hypothetical protein